MDNSREVRVPPLYCPIPEAMNPHADGLNRLGFEWISQFGIYDRRPSQLSRHIQSNLGYLPARVMPRAPQGPALQAAVNYYLWLWALDDIKCDETIGNTSLREQIFLFGSLARLAESPARSVRQNNPFAAALSDIRRQLEQVATHVQLARWASATQAYLQANIVVTAQQANGIIPGLDEYAALRIHSGAMKPTLMLLDIASGYELPAAEMEHPDMQALDELVCTIVGWDNDLLSYHKEIARGGSDHNLITVLAHASGQEPAHVVGDAIAMRDRALVLFLRLRDQLSKVAGAEAQQYMADLSSWIRGHIDWGLSTIRYRNQEYRDSLPQSFSESPSNDSSEPLRISSIAWWWERLHGVPRQQPP